MNIHVTLKGYRDSQQPDFSDSSILLVARTLGMVNVDMPRARLFGTVSGEIVPRADLTPQDNVVVCKHKLSVLDELVLLVESDADRKVIKA